MDQTTTPEPKVSRSGLILGAAGLAGAAALAGLPRTADAASAPPRTTYKPLEFETAPAHPHYHRGNFDSAKAHVVFHTLDGKQSMHTRVEDIHELAIAHGVRGSKEWAGNFAVLFARTGGAQLPDGMYIAETNGKSFKLTITRIAKNEYEAVVVRTTPKGA